MSIEHAKVESNQPGKQETGADPSPPKSSVMLGTANGDRKVNDKLSVLQPRKPNANGRIYKR